MMLDSQEIEFLGDAVKELLPAIVALRDFAGYCDRLLRAAVQPHDDALAQIGLVTSRGRAACSPQLTDPSDLELGFWVELRGGPRSSFYLQLLPDAEDAACSMWLGFRICPATIAEAELLPKRMASALSPTDGLALDEAEDGTYVGRYLDLSLIFPRFVVQEADRVIVDCLRVMKEVDFLREFTPSMKKRPGV